MDAWITEELRHAPAGLSHGWFISNLKFYDLQDSLSGGTLVAMALSVAVAFSVMLLTTWNVIISLYAILSIAGTIFVTVGSLVLLGWELNVLESVTISVAVGLSVDFAVHYGVAYRLAPEPDREGKVIFSLSRMGSAIAMAALTTFVAGAMMMPSTVLAYTQLGTFMMLIMCISWAFATFFFQCMCRCLGPQGDCGQIPLPKKLQRRVFSQVASADPSSQGKGGGADAERYELEPLAYDQRAEDKAKREREACNGVPRHHHVGKSQPESGKSSPNDGVTSPPLCAHYPHTANCACGDPPPPLSPHLHPDWAPYPCAQTPPEPHTPQLSPRSAATANNQTAAAAHIRCLPAHFHHCTQGRMAGARQGPVPTCQLRNLCSRTATGSAREARSTAQNPERTPASGAAGTAAWQNIEPPSLKQAQTGDPSPASDAPPAGHTPVAPATPTETASPVLAWDHSVPQNPKKERASSASPERLDRFSRTLKSKRSSASEMCAPTQTETSESSC